MASSSARGLRATVAALGILVALLPAAASAHPGGLAKDGCHNHRASGTCHCHRAGASRPGCTADGESPASAPAPPGPEAARSALPPLPAGRIRIASWNLNRLHWRTNGALWRGAVVRESEDYEDLARYARNLDADIIAFQEVNGPRAAARVFRSRDYDLHFSGRYDSRYDDIYNGFAVRKGRFDRVIKRDHPALGGAPSDRYPLRWGVDLTVFRDGERLRLLNVHLKSRCFAKSLDPPRDRHCRKLARQIEPLESWIDERWREGVPFVVLGDFNRAFDRHGPRDHLWSALDDGDPRGLELHRLPAGNPPACWRGTSRYHRHPIDFFVFGARAWRRVDAASFRQLVWTDADADPHRGLPSDHCPIAVDLF